MSLATTTKLTVDDVVKAARLMQEGDSALRTATVSARSFRFDFQSTVFKAVKVDGVTAAKVVSAFEAEAEQDADFAEIAKGYKSNTSVGVAAECGRLYTLPGTLPENASPSSLHAAIQKIGVKASLPIMRKKSATQETAYLEIMALWADAKEADKAEKGAEQYLKAAQGTISKAVKLAVDDPSRTIALAIVADLQKWLAVNK